MTPQSPPQRTAPSPSPDQDPYQGTENLVLMEKILRNYNRWVVDKFVLALEGRKREGLRVLDFGSGLATLSKIFQKVTGVKPDTLDIDNANRLRAAEQGFRAYSTLDDLPIHYDVVFTSNVLEHIEDDVGTLKALRMHMRKDAQILIYVPAFACLWTFMDDMVGHVRRYKREDLIEKVTAAGFTVEAAEYCDSVGFLFSYLFKFFGSKNRGMPTFSLYVFDRVLLPLTKVFDPLFKSMFGKNLYLVARRSG